jgi:4-azaleucine resistance transporter AzlC
MRLGIFNTVPLALGAAAYGFAFGIVAAQYGYPWWGVAIMSGAVHSSSAQMVASQQFATDELIMGAAFAGVALNLRFLATIASLHDLLAETSFLRRLLIIHIIGDETWALTLAKRTKDPAIGVRFLIGSGLTMIITWVLSTAAGALLGQYLPDLSTYSLGFAFTAAFIAMTRAMWRGAPDLLPWAITAAAAMALVGLGVNQAYAILLAALTGVLVCAIQRHKGLRP